MLDWTFEERYPYSAICGVDEAGRGPLAGPVVAAAVILPRGCVIEGLDDSKKLTEKKRERLYDEICAKAVGYSIAAATHERIDEINILQATFEAMTAAVEKLNSDLALIDGNLTPTLPIPCECVIGGDGIVPAIAAASVLAKVTRDRAMVELAERYPGYGFERHKGYGTKAHYAAILEQGICPIHRLSFLKKLFAEHPELRP